MTAFCLHFSQSYLACQQHLRSIDIQPALELSGLDGQVVDVILATDVQGSNIIGAVIKDEEVFASIGKDSLRSVGQIIGVCVATTLNAAKEGARAVKVGYPYEQSCYVSLRFMKLDICIIEITISSYSILLLVAC